MTRAPRVDVHAHPGRCFLAGIPDADPARAVLGTDDAIAGFRGAEHAGMAAVSFATVADLRVLQLVGNRFAAAREFAPGEAYADHQRQLEAIHEMADRVDATIVSGADDVMRLHRAGQTGLLVTCEGADFVESGRDADAFERVHEAFDRGVRSITIVHYRQNRYGDLQTEPPLHHGLSTAGRELVAIMNDVGMIVDLAHASFETTVDAVAVSRHPVMISHSHLTGPRSDHPRLVTDEHACAVTDAGGLIGAWPSGVASETLDDFIDEVVRLVDLVGVEHVAIGTDLDANDRPVLTEYRQFDDLDDGLTARGLGPDDIDRVLGGNAVDLIRTVCGS
ncbi:dipeptidase [Ilumatobacter sp.]|uniref:dipeptidase n=1 Tax=Ilumatobacter sp. TaxID=1967498 RepID=UPI003C61C8A5